MTIDDGIVIRKILPILTVDKQAAIPVIGSGVYGFPLIIFAVLLRMNRFMTVRAYYQSFPSAFPH